MSVFAVEFEKAPPRFRGEVVADRRGVEEEWIN